MVTTRSTSAVTFRLRTLVLTASRLSRMNCASSMRNPFASRPLLQRHVRLVALAELNLLGSVGAVVLELLEPVGQPAGDAGDGKDRCEQVGRNAQRLVDDAGIEIHIRIDALRSDDRCEMLLERHGQVV